MPDEPNKKMDEMLRAYAKERRKAADVPLHPATRNLLQGEVRRVFGTAEPQPWWKRLRAFWPQLTFAGSMCLILGIAILSLRQPPRNESSTSTPAGSEVELLKQAERSGVQEKAVESKLKERMDDRDRLGVSEPLKISPKPEQPAPQKNVETLRGLERAPKASAGTAIAPPQLPSVAPQESFQERGEELQMRERVLTDSASASAPVVAPELRLQKKMEAPAKADEAKDSAATAPRREFANERLARSATVGRSTSVGLRQENVSLAADMTNLGAARRLNFVQVSNVNARGAAAMGTNAVLTSFQVEQLGNNVKFLDRDGSIYVGELEATNSAAALAVADDATKLDASAAYYFRVQGTNRTLGKDVVLIGEYFEQTNQAPSSLDTFAITPASATRPKIQPRHLIIGNATVGATNQVPVRAVANEP